MKTLFIGRFIATPAADDLVIREGAVLVSDNNGHGTIEQVVWNMTNTEDIKRAFGLDADNDGELEIVMVPSTGFLFPGFIDTHIHAPQYPNCGIFGKSTLLDWLTTYTFPLESSLGSTESPAYKNLGSDEKPDPLKRARKVYSRVIERTLSHGTTTAAYYATLHVPTTNLLSELTYEKGQRALIGRVCMDHEETCPDFYRDEGTEDTLAKTREVTKFCQDLDETGMLVAPIITPRFAPSCQAETLTALGEYAQRENLRIQTHISENLNEIELVKKMYPDQNSYAGVYDEHQLLTERTILAHAIHFDEKEIELVSKRKSKISHCPASNSALGSGFCPVRKLLDAGIEVGLGTDVSGGYSPSVLEAVRQACLVSRHVGYLNEGNSRHNIGVTEGLWLATVGGARVVGLDGKVGGFEKGMLFDVQQIDLGSIDDDGATSGENNPIDVFGWENWEEKIAKWVWNGDDRNVTRVWVGGRLVHGS